MLPRHGLHKAEFQRRIEALLPRTAGYAWTMVRNREDAEDAVQEAALKAYRNRKRYDRSRPLKGWWFAIVRNCCLDLLRRRRLRSSEKLTDGDEMSAHDPPNPGEYEELHQALVKLSPSHREILELRYFADCFYRDIAAALEIPEGTVMSRLHAARGALAALLRKENR